MNDNKLMMEVYNGKTKDEIRDQAIIKRTFNVPPGFQEVDKWCLLLNCIITGNDYDAWNMYPKNTVGLPINNRHLNKRLKLIMDELVTGYVKENKGTLHNVPIAIMAIICKYFAVVVSRYMMYWMAGMEEGLEPGTATPGSPPDDAQWNWISPLENEEFEDQWRELMDNSDDRKEIDIYNNNKLQDEWINKIYNY